MKITVACQTKTCAQFGKVKVLERAYLGQGLFSGTPIICGGCGLAVKEPKK